MKMNEEKCLTIGTILLFVGVAVAPSIHFTTVNASTNDNQIKAINQKELLFQTIVDMANNKEIQQVILKSQISKEGFFNPDVKFPILNTPVLTKNQIKQMYLVGLLLSKIISKSRTHSMLERYQMNNQWVQKETTAVIEKNATIKEELTQLLNSNCNCGDSTGVTVWHFPVICTILEVILFFDLLITWWLHVGTNILKIVGTLLERFNCPGWTP